LFVANGLHVPPIAYKLRALDLPGLILQVAGTPTHGVLVSVSAVVCTRILVSDRIGVCLYRAFSNLNLTQLLDWSSSNYMNVNLKKTKEVVICPSNSNVLAH